MSGYDYGWEGDYGTSSDAPYYQDYDDEVNVSHSYAAGGRSSETPLADFGLKKAPVFTPGSSFFRYEKDVKDWLKVTTCTPDACGMNLVLQCAQKAKFLKDHIDRVSLDQGLEDPDDKKSANLGVKCLLDFLRKH